MDCVYCGAEKTGYVAILAPACSKKECREKASTDLGLTFQQLCVLQGLAMGYGIKQIGDHMEPSQQPEGKRGITEDGVKQHIRLIGNKLKKLGLQNYNKSTALVAWYIARVMELDYATLRSQESLACFPQL